jgi:hypothetical protein
MTASSEHKEPILNEKEHNGLPGAFEILLYSLTLTKRYAHDVYGFAAYILFPIILAFGTQHVSGRFGDVIAATVNVLLVLIACWIQATIITTVSMRSAHPKKDPDPRSIGLYATSILGTLVLTALLSGLLQFAGYILFVIPGIIASVLFAFAPQEVVLHGAGPLSALAASRAKVQPQFFPVLWRLFVLTAAAVGSYLLTVSFILTIAGFGTGMDAMALANATPAWLDAVLTVLQIVFLPPFIIGHTVLYLSLNEPEKSEAEGNRQE